MLSDDTAKFFKDRGFTMFELRGAGAERWSFYAWGHEVGSVFTTEKTALEAIANAIAKLGGNYDMSYNRSGRLEAQIVSRCRLTEAIRRKLLLMGEEDEL